MICSSCQQETTLVRVGSSEYCRRCQARQGQPAVPAEAPQFRSMDIRTAQRPAAANLHNRTTPARRGQILDLRPAKPAAGHPHSLAEARTAAITSQPPTLPATHREPALPPKTAAREQHTAHFQDKFERAKGVPRSQHIAKFGHEFAHTGHPAAQAEFGPQPLERFEDRFQDNFAPSHHEVASPELPAHAVTAHEALKHLAPAPHFSSTTNRSWRNVNTPRASQIMAISATIAIMGGYIWLQNYPKLALKSASHEAGITVSLPGYIPSSYSLAATDTKPGLVTFRFTSPSQTEALTIAQQRTSWDSSSLLDNFVAKQTNNYSAIEGQGLTIYLYDQNRAAWVNHGIRYEITGAGRLSRDQVLKIAYSL